MARESMPRNCLRDRLRRSAAALVGGMLLLAAGGAAQAEEALPRATILALQDALLWSGDFKAPADGTLGEATIAALKAFQARENRPVTGQLSAEDARRLKEVAAVAKREVGLETVIDAKGDIVVPVPRALLEAASRGPLGRKFASRDGLAAFETFVRPKGTLKAYLDEVRRGKPTTAENVRPDRFLVSLDDNGTVVHIHARETKDAVKGFVMRYPASEALRYEKIAIAVAQGFDPEPGADKGPQEEPPSLDMSDQTGSVDPAAGPKSLTLDENRLRGQLVAGRVKVDARIDVVKNGDETDFVPKLVILVDDRKVGELAARDDPWGATSVDISIVELDAENAFPEVVLTYFTGGAHCCTVMRLFSAPKEGGPWREIDGGSYDGGAALYADHDKDGRYEIVSNDDAFLYAFDCYACSYAPPRIQRLEAGKLVDVTTDPSFRPFLREKLNELWLWANSARAIESNGFLAGLVATERRLGEGEEAWAFLLKHYDKSNDQGLETCASGKPLDSCPPEQRKTLPFPEALAGFLTRQGYP